jgi:hypothetical protein
MLRRPTHVLRAEHRLNEAIENAHRTGLTASDTWSPTPPVSRVDTLALDARLRRMSAKGWRSGAFRPEHHAPLTGPTVQAQRRSVNAAGARATRPTGNRSERWLVPETRWTRLETIISRQATQRR